MTKIGLRKAWFQAHKWIGLILAIVIVPICLTGSALVWHDGLDRMLNAGRYATTAGAATGADRHLDAARAVLPGDARIASFRMPEHAGDPVVVSAVSARPGAPQRTNVYLDPPTARVLDVAGSNAGAVRVMHVIHGSLMIPGVGRSIVGWIGVAMLISSISGLWLWWPTVGRWARGLRWRRHRDFDTNLHHMMGFWIALPLFILSLTGAWISFPAFFGPLVGEGPRAAAPNRAAQQRARPLESPATPLAAALTRAQAVAPGEVRQIAFPTDLKPEWVVTSGGMPVTIVDSTGAVEAGPASGERAKTSVARWMRRIHDGTDMGIVWQVVVFLGGLLPAALAVTGVIMWWRARRWRGEARARSAAE